MNSYEAASAQRTLLENFYRGTRFDDGMCLARCAHTCTPSIKKSTSEKFISNHYLFLYMGRLASAGRQFGIFLRMRRRCTMHDGIYLFFRTVASMGA